MDGYVRTSVLITDDEDVAKKESSTFGKTLKKAEKSSKKVLTFVWEGGIINKLIRAAEPRERH